MSFYFKKYKLLNITCFVLGLYFFNISVDATDTIYYNCQEDLNYNNQESVIEIFIEKILGYENAIAEHEDNDNQQSSLFKKIKAFEYTLLDTINTALDTNLNFSDKKLLNYYSAAILNTNIDIIYPPPQVD